MVSVTVMLNYINLFAILSFLADAKTLEIFLTFFYCFSGVVLMSHQRSMPFAHVYFDRPITTKYIMYYATYNIFYSSL